MKRIVLVLCVILGAQPLTFGLERNAFTFIRYDLKVNIDPGQQTLQASGTLTLRNDSPRRQKIAVLQVSSALGWKSIKSAGKALQYLSQDYTSDLDHSGALSEAVVTLPQEVAPQGMVELEVDYGGVLRADSTRLTRIGTPAEVAARTDWDRVSPTFTAVRGIGYVVWYPVATEAASLSEGSAVFTTISAWRARAGDSTMRLALCAPLGANGILVANGEPVGSSTGEPPSCPRLEYQHLGLSPPVFALGTLRTIRQGTTVVFHAPGHEQAAAQYATVAQSVQPLITNWFGPPRRPVQIVELPDTKAMPYESGGMLLTPLSGGDAQQVQLTLAHQLTHASFYSPRLWMYEGLAHFAQALEREQQEANKPSAKAAPGQMLPGRKAAIAYMDAQLPPLTAAEESQLPEAPDPTATAAPTMPRGEPLITATDEVFYRTKAMFVWWMLRDMVGDQALQRAIQTYRADQDKEPSYFQRLLTAEAHRDLEWFFDDWVYRDRGLPEFHIVSAYPRALLPADYSVTVTIDNAGGAGAEVPVTVRAARGDVDRRVEVRAREKAVVRMPVPDVPKEAIVNDGSVPEYSLGHNRVGITVPPRRE